MATYDFQPYDVLQISSNLGETWDDFTTLREEREGHSAKRLVDNHRGKDAVRYRITRNQREVYS